VENISQVAANPVEVGHNHDARKAVSATLSVLKRSGSIFSPRSSKVNVQKVLLCPFHCKPRPSGVRFRVPGPGKYTPSSGKSSHSWSKS